MPFTVDWKSVCLYFFQKLLKYVYEKQFFSYYICNLNVVRAPSNDYDSAMEP